MDDAACAYLDSLGVTSLRYPSKSQIVPVLWDLFQTQGQILPELNQKPGKTTTEPLKKRTQEAKLVFSSFGNTPE